MDEDAPHQIRWPRVVARVGGHVVLAVVLYVLSAGPVYYLFGTRSVALDRALFAIYTPLSWFAVHSKLHEPLVRYNRWWYALPGGVQERYLRETPPLPAANDVGPAETIP